MTEMDREGNELFELLVQLTGIETSRIRSELAPFLERMGLSPATLTLDDVRRVMIAYLEELSESVAADATEDSPLENDGTPLTCVEA
jgi:hypothetical protein